MMANNVFYYFAALLVVSQLEQINGDITNSYCYNEIKGSCNAGTKQTTIFGNCTARFGGIGNLESELATYATSHITRSFEYLLMSTHFGNFEMNREGFQKLYRGLSDEKWGDAIDLIKHITKRGGQMTFLPKDVNEANVERREGYELNEIESLAKALDLEKDSIKDAYSIHEKAIKRSLSDHDPEVSSFLENSLIHRQANTIRRLSGYVFDLTKLLSDSDSSLAVYLFDDYIKDQ